MCMTVKFLKASLCLQALQQMHKILGQVDIVGVPFTLGSSLVEGVTSLVVAPTQAKSPKEFFDSVGRGFFILFRNAAYGIMHALGQVHILHAPCIPTVLRLCLLDLFAICSNLCKTVPTAFT